MVVEFDALPEPTAEVSGFELGHVTLRWDDGVYSSRDLGSRGLLMVYLAATDMLNGVVTLLSHPDASYAFTGAGSSWSFAVRRTRRHNLHLTSAGGTPLCRTSEADYAVAVWRGTKQLLANRAPVQGGAGFDLNSAIEAYPVRYQR